MSDVDARVSDVDVVRLELVVATTDEIEEILGESLEVPLVEAVDRGPPSSLQQHPREHSKTRYRNTLLKAAPLPTLIISLRYSAPVTEWAC